MHRSWRAIILALLLAVCIPLTNSLPEFSTSVGAATLSQAYHSLKANFPQTVAQLKAADPSIADSDIESFVSDLSAELQTRGDLTGANIENKFYDAFLSVIINRKHDKVVNAALAGFGVTWDDILKKRIPPGFQAIKSALKAELLPASGVPSDPAAGGDKKDRDAPETPPPGAVAEVSPQVLEEAVKKSSASGVIQFSADPGAGVLALSKGQIGRIGDPGKPVEARVQGVGFLFPPGALKAAAAASATFQVQIEARKVTGADRPVKGARHKVAGEVYELGVTALLQDGRKVEIGEFSPGITLFLPVPAGYAGSPADLKVFRLNEEDGEWVMVGGSFESASGAVACTTTHLSKYVLMEVKQEMPAAQFSDITGHWAEKDILAMAARGVIKGADGRAMPDQMVTRAQFATFLVLLLDLPGTGEDLPFSDADRSAWYYQSLSAAYGAGLVSGYGDGRIGPGDYITREQMAVMVAGALKCAGKPVPPAAELPFGDRGSVSPWASGAVSAAFSMEIIKGFPDNTYRPGENATRAQAVVILSRLTDKL